MLRHVTFAGTVGCMNNTQAMDPTDPKTLTEIRPGYWISVDGNVEIMALSGGVYGATWRGIHGTNHVPGTFPTVEDADAAASAAWDKACA